MGSITISVTGDASVGTKSKSLTVTNANINRLISFAQGMGNPGGGPPPTPAQAFDRWVDFVMDQTKAHLIQRERARSRNPAVRRYITNPTGIPSVANEGVPMTQQNPRPGQAPDDDEDEGTKPTTPPSQPSGR